MYTAAAQCARHRRSPDKQDEGCGILFYAHLLEKRRLPFTDCTNTAIGLCVPRLIGPRINTTLTIMRRRTGAGSNLDHNANTTPR
jgi:hypothetical protein